MTVEHASRLVGQLLDQYEAPPLDEAIGEELEAFVEKRREQGGSLA